MIRMFRRNPVMSPLSGSVGLLEKRIDAFSGLSLVDVAAAVGDFGHGFSSTLLLDSDAISHTNHGSDPGSHTMALGDSATVIMDKPRELTSNVTFADAAHACLCGYHPSSSSTPTGLETLTASETVNIGQPVIVLTTNSVSKANAYLGLIPIYTVGYPIGLAASDATSGNDIQIRTEGSVTQSDWTLVTGTTSLTVGAWYFLDGPTSGKLTTSAITTDGYVAIRVGRALDTQRLDIEISDGVIV